MRKALGLLVLALATGLIAAGCGDDDDDGGDAPSKEEFVADGNQICEEGSSRLDTAAEETFGQGGEPTPEEQEQFITETLVPDVQGQIDDIRDLGAPEGDEDEINGILEDAEAALDELEANPTFEGGDPFADVNRRLADYGLTACADGE